MDMDVTSAVKPEKPSFDLKRCLLTGDECRLVAVTGFAPIWCPQRSTLCVACMLKHLADTLEGLDEMRDDMDARRRLRLNDG